MTQNGAKASFESVDLNRLKKIAQQIRMDIIEMLEAAGSGHPGSSLSSVELITSLYFHYMKHDPKNPEDPHRDKFILSKGHGVPTLYAAMAEAGYFDRSLLKTLRKLESPLQGHPDKRRLPGIEASTGSLGQGLSVAQGYAMADKLDSREAYTFCMIGDGETQEGQIWEAAMSAPKFKLDRLIAITDFNKAQIDGYVEDVMPIEPLSEKWKAFGWDVTEIDGHDWKKIFEVLDWATTHQNGNPKMIIAHTVKGKGVSFMENQVGWHGKAPNAEEAKKALDEIRQEAL
jgi:transketolase